MVKHDKMRYQHREYDVKIPLTILSALASGKEQLFQDFKSGFKKSAESDTTRPSRNRLGPNRVDTDTGYVGMLGIGGTRYKSVILGQLGRVSRDDSATRQKTKKSNLCFLLNQKIWKNHL